MTKAICPVCHEFHPIESEWIDTEFDDGYLIERMQPHEDDEGHPCSGAGQQPNPDDIVED